MKNEKLVLEIYGMPFDYRDSVESKVSDLHSFRVAGWLSKSMYVEVVTHFREHLKKVNSFIDFSLYDREGCHAILEKNGYCKPTKKAVLEYINAQLGTHYKELVIKGAL